MWSTISAYQYRTAVGSFSYSVRSIEECQAETDEPKGLYSTYLNNATRTQMLLLDYKQFKSARIIQKTFRGWRVRNHLEKQQKAAKMIQRIWRRYHVVHNLETIAEVRVQESINILFRSSSVKIQSTFRGWWSRRHISDFHQLNKLQVNAVQDILYDMIGRLHSMKRTKELPGIVSFCNQECLLKVQNLLSTLSYRLYNHVVDRRRLKTLNRLHDQFKLCEKSELYTWVPYLGNDCESPQINEMEFPSQEDPLEIDIKNRFNEAQRTMHKQKATLKDMKRKAERSKHGLPNNQYMFCHDMMHKIKNWKILEEADIRKSWLDSSNDAYIPEFLSDIKAHLEACNYVENCYCKHFPWPLP